MNNFIQKKRRYPMSLQLTAMIDIFSIIVIFLILGSVMGTTDVVIPGTDFVIPKSVSKESVNGAPQVVISNTSVMFPALKLELKTESFLRTSKNTQEMDSLNLKLKKYLKELPESSKGSGYLLNVVADEKVPYGKLFEILKVFRAAGFESLLFVTSPKKGSS